MNKLPNIFVVAFAALLVIACQPEVIEREIEVTREVPVTAEAEELTIVDEVEPECCDVFRVSMHEEPTTANFWSFYGPDASTWTWYAVADQPAWLYGLSDKRFDYVPALALDLPPDPAPEGDYWTATVEIVNNAKWADGHIIDAHDVAFTLNTCLELELGGNWINACQPDILDRVEATDDWQVKFYFHEPPGLAQWQYGVAWSPILPEHKWGEVVAGAFNAIEGLQEPDDGRPTSCGSAELPEADVAICDQWDAYDEAYVNARAVLFNSDGIDMPVFGGYALEDWERGAFLSFAANDLGYLNGGHILQYEDGTYREELQNGLVRQLYGEAEGDVTLDMAHGPYSSRVILSLYGSQDASYLALADGDVDYIINPLATTRGLRELAESGEGIQTYTNDDNGMFYLAFNLRKYPMSLPEFREAIDIIIDKEFILENVLQGVATPMYSPVPAGNTFWHTEIETPYVGQTREWRIQRAVDVLKSAGWSWTTEPSWDDEKEDSIPGVGLRMPNGELMPEVVILGPGPAYDPVRATFNQWISEWANELGMPVESELTGFNTILGPVFIEASFDMYILGWGLGNPSFPDYLHGFWDCDQDVLLGGFNTPGYCSDEYDALAEEFITTNSIDRARELAFEMQRLIARDRPYILLFLGQHTDFIRENVEIPYTESLNGIQTSWGFMMDFIPLFK